VKGTPLRFLATGAMVAALAVAWFAFAPAQLGGTVTYVSTHGQSMEPKMHQGDLVLVRAADDYRVGDVIAYRSKSLDRIILHRIIRSDGDRFVTQGDNNDWIDSDEPTIDDVVGKMWLKAGGIGSIAQNLRTPTAIALIGALSALAWFAMSNRTKRETDWSEGRTMSLRLPREILSYALAALGAFALVTGFAYARPLTTSEEAQTPYKHTGSFTYSATAPRGPVYEDGEITTGEPVFLRLADEVDVSFTYELRSALETEVGGKAKLDVQIGDPSGWNRTFELAAQKNFDGTAVTLNGTIDIAKIRDLIGRVERATSMPRDLYPVSIVPTIDVSGRIGGQEVGERFSPALGMQLDALQLQMTPAGSYAPGAEPTADPLAPSMEGSISDSDLVAASVELLGVEIEVETLRTLGLLGLIASALAAAALFYASRTGGDARARFASSHSELLVPVTPSTLDAYDKIVEVTDPDALVAMADRRDRMILTFERNGVDHYVLDQDGVAYVARVETLLDPAAEHASEPS
jgi:signal peptidase I